MPPFIEKALAMPMAARLLIAANAVSLLFALIMQYGFGYEPCILCLWQRIPFAAAAFLAILAAISPRFAFHALMGCAVLYVAGTGLAFFHSGVEQHWWAGTSGCTVQPLAGTSIEDLREAILKTITARCDEVAWTILGLSMANLNVAWSLALAVFSARAAKSLQK